MRKWQKRKCIRIGIRGHSTYFENPQYETWIIFFLVKFKWMYSTASSKCFLVNIIVIRNRMKKKKKSKIEQSGRVFRTMNRVRKSFGSTKILSRNSISSLALELLFVIQEHTNWAKKCPKYIHSIDLAIKCSYRTEQNFHTNDLLKFNNILFLKKTFHKILVSRLKVHTIYFFITFFVFCSWFGNISMRLIENQYCPTILDYYGFCDYIEIATNNQWDDSVTHINTTSFCVDQHILDNAGHSHTHALISIKAFDRIGMLIVITNNIRINIIALTSCWN